MRYGGEGARGLHGARYRDRIRRSVAGCRAESTARACFGVTEWSSEVQNSERDGNRGRAPSGWWARATERRRPEQRATSDWRAAARADDGETAEASMSRVCVIEASSAFRTSGRDGDQDVVRRRAKRRRARGELAAQLWFAPDGRARVEVVARDRELRDGRGGADRELCAI